MKTLEQRATEYACGGIIPDDVGCYSCYLRGDKCEREAYIAGAKSERAALLRWRTLGDELPVHGRLVLVQHGERRAVSLVLYQQSQDGCRVWEIVDSNHIIQESSILGWRPVCDL